MTATPPLHAQDPTGRFSNRAKEYARYRPSYPAPAIDAVLHGLGDPSRLRAADFGAGTGIFSRLLGDRGVHVTAIEPNSAMRAAAAPHPNVHWLAATAESSTLPDSSVDLVICAQAFHWFEPRKALIEFHRVLRGSARLALVWNMRDRRDALTAGYRDAILEVGGADPAEQRKFDPSTIVGSGQFCDLALAEFSHEQRLNLEGLVGRAMSASYSPKEGPRAARLVERLHELHRRHADAAGVVVLRYITQVYRSTRA